MPSRLEQLSQWIADLEGDEASLLASLKQVRETRRHLIEAKKAEESLSITAQQRSMLGSKMETENHVANKRVKISQAMTTNASEAKQALTEAGLTPQDVADKRKVGRSTVDAWCRGTRPIPRKHREWLTEKYGIPARVWLKRAD